MSTTLAPFCRRKAKTVSGAIKQAHDHIIKEGNWIQSRWVADGVVIDPQAPLCDQGWGACSDGILRSVVYGVPVVELEPGVCVTVDFIPGIKSREDQGQDGTVRYTDDGTPEDDERYLTARDYLDEASGVGDIVRFNDRRTRDEVVEVFRKAWRHAQYEERKARAAHRFATAD